MQDTLLYDPNPFSIRKMWNLATARIVHMDSRTCEIGVPGFRGYNEREIQPIRDTHFRYTRAWAQRRRWRVKKSPYREKFGIEDAGFGGRYQ